LPSLRQLAQSDHILWGSDYPFVSVERLAEEIRHWQADSKLDAETRARIERDNALRLLPPFTSR